MATADAEKLNSEFQQLQTELSELITARQKLETQYQENKIVKDEFDALDDDAKVYKLTGPVLLPQDKEEAAINVAKRIEFIQGEIKRVEGQMTNLQKDLTEKRQKLIALRSAQPAPATSA